MSNLYSRLHAHQIDVHAVSYLRGDLDSAALRQKLDGCDLAIINGEGTIHHGNPYAEKLLELVSRSTADKRALINATYDSNPYRYRKHLSTFDYIFVRDSQSQSELKSCGINSSVVPDLALATQPPHPGPRTQETIVVDSVDRDVVIYLHKLGKTNGDLRPLSIFVRNSGFSQQVKALRQSIAAADMRRPRYLADMIQARLWFMSEACDDHKQFAGLIAQAGFLITGRYHAVCVALITKTPFLAIESNTFKVRALLEDAGLTHRYISKTKLYSEKTPTLSPLESEEKILVDRFVSDSSERIDKMFSRMVGHG